MSRNERVVEHLRAVSEVQAAIDSRIEESARHLKQASAEMRARQTRRRAAKLASNSSDFLKNNR